MERKISHDVTSTAILKFYRSRCEFNLLTTPGSFSVGWNGFCNTVTSSLPWLLPNDQDNISTLVLTVLPRARRDRETLE